MRKNLPYRNQERLDVIFEHVYDSLGDAKAERAFAEAKLNHLLRVLKTIQEFNIEHILEEQIIGSP